MDTTILSQELASDPKGFGYAAHVAAGDDQILADMLNAVYEDILIPQLVPLYEVKMLLLESGEYLPLTAATSAEARPAVELLGDQRFENVDLTIAAVQTMFSALVTQSLISSDTHDSIVKLGYHAGSRAEQLGLGSVSHMDVAKALGR